MRAMAFAWRSLVRQPARAGLGILGVAAVGALLFDMLLLSNGLVTSMRDMLERTGFDIRVTAMGELPQGGMRIGKAAEALRAVAALPGVERVLTIRFTSGGIVGGRTAPSDQSQATNPLATEEESPEDREPRQAVDVPLDLQAVGGTGAMPWTVITGRDITGPLEVVVTRETLDDLGLHLGGDIRLRARCQSRREALPPTTVTVVGVVDLPLAFGTHVAATSMATLETVCGGNAADEVDALLVRAAGDPDRTAEAIRRVRVDLRPMTNAQVLGRVQRTGFTYFQQISAVLTTVTLGFALLLITVLQTVSVNQRLGEIAALRALGFSRGRVVADVLCESCLIVGLGGVLSLPVGLALAHLLDGILKAMPGIPGPMHFFVFQREALAWHAGLLALTALAAALYPMSLVAKLPIASTLRAEVTS